MITAYGGAGNYETAIQLGADVFLHKPVDFAALNKKQLNCHECKTQIAGRG